MRECKWVSAWVVGILLLTAPVVALAATPAQEREEVARQDESPAFAAGIVLAVDPDDGRLTLEQASLDGERLTFVVDAETELKKEGRTIELATIAVGDPVSIEYATGPAGEKLAGSVEVLTTPAEESTSTISR